jgi:hypothetical protein
MTFVLASWKILGLCSNIKLQSDYLLAFKAQMVVTTSLLCPKNECQRLLVMHLGHSKGCGATLTHKRTIGYHSRQDAINNIVTMPAQRVSTKYQ